uniref:Cullin 7 n=1 Tax=Callorhinchus milii TaxID=7868 RepID=A0A4W3JLD0_CALMI
MGERRSRNLLVQLGPKMQAYPEELIRQRRSYDGLAEYLIRWNVGSNGSHSSSSDNKVENILMWMSVEDVYANCPTLLGKRKLESQRPKEEQEPSAGSCPSGPDSDVTFDDVELLDMKEDVKLLVERARRQMSRKCGADSSLNISHTIHVLSAYASIGSLVGVFKETGALDVLMELLCNKETQTRRSAGKMLRALASHDAGSRAYVLLSLSQQDGIEQHMDFDNRYTLLELFAETTSSEEHGISFEGIHLPQIPGKLLFSLVKRYLCVTSLMDKLNNSGQEAGGERQDCNAPHVPEQTRILREFEFTLAMANLISELVRVMGWDRNRHPEPGESEMPRNVKSIFQPRSLSISSVLAPQPRKKSAATYKTRSNFSSRSSYVEYVQENLKAGMTVKMLEDYEQVNAGDEGEFRFSNDGTPPVQVFWHQLNRTYWVHWHMIEIIEDGWNGQVDKESQEKASSLTENLKLTTVTQTFFHKPPGGLYSLPYLSDNVAEDSSTLSRAEWWEVLFFIKKLEPKQQQEAVDIIHQSLEEQVSVMDESALIQLTVPVELAQKLLQFVGPHCPAAYLTDLESSHVYIKHYLRRRGLGLDHLSGTLAGAEYGSPPGTAGSSSSSSTSSTSLSKETKKEIPPDPTSPGLSSGRTDTAQAPEMGRMEELELPDDLEEKLKGRVGARCDRYSNNPRLGYSVYNVKHVSRLPRLASERSRVQFLEEDSSRDKLSLKVDSGLNHRDKLIKAVVEQLSSLAREKVLVVTCFRLLYILMQRYDWRVLFATEGGIKAVLSCMQEHRNSALVQQAALATLKILTGASKYDMRSKSVRPHLAEADAQIILEIFASIGSASTHDSKGLLITTLFCEVFSHYKYCIKAKIVTYYNPTSVSSLSLSLSLSPPPPSPCGLQVLQDFIRFLYGLATVNKDYAVVMCRLGSKETLSKALDKHSATLPLAAELRDLVGDCEKYASLYKKMTTSILAGCIQMVLGQIEEHRRSHQPINIPFFHVFLRNLCQGSGVELKEDKCWEKIEVSSNHHRTSKLTDKNPKSYWESNGSTGSHYINIYMHKGVVIRQLTLLVASEDSSYMPARVVVMGGDDPSNINTELNTVNVAPTANRVLLLENMTRYWSIIQIRIKRCQQGGIDTRVHGFEVLGPKPTFWPVFKEQLCCRTYLFYTTKAHTWCQEILEDRMQLLQLFNKLNSALRHEQMFADRFLPDAEASEALGRTCWEALINPIVQSITTLGNADPSPLTWLLTEYLENSDNSKRGKGRAVIFNSRVRRLCHLLVHVDTSRNEVEELKPAIKSGNQRCYVVNCTIFSSRQVKHFLDGAWNSTDFVQRYRNMYLRLKNAMEELFGQQTAFVLALRKGFSGGLLQLSHLTAMHVSERFAQYIDQRIQESGADASSVETLNQLQQFLEPMLFFSGLELANIFEHFYRYYLGDRLLGQGKVWLERAIIDQIGSCFPGRFPQQMLKNLSESNELQQEFHLYRLQQLDKKLENMDDEVSSVSYSSDVRELSTELAVLVLSPRCWSISLCHLENPARYFPPDLSDFLEEFSDFYTSSDTKPRRLQWTWLGHAVLSYGSLTLHVSTLQMYILLLFNQQEEIAVETILRLTGLSLVLVQHALKPLIEEDGILSHTQTEQSQGSVVSQCYTLLPKQTYLNVDEDAASALDRKRNVIYCIIVQIMKSEKELHIDNLVFKVTNHLWIRLAVARPFSSTTNMDVLCCIMHLINEGYVRRNEDNPHILEYVLEDPITPRKGQAAVWGCFICKPSPDSECGVLETVLLSMGRTMSQEEVQQLMSQTVLRVADTLSVSADIAQNLLIHSKWNVDLLVQRYAEDPDTLLLAAGLQVRNPQAPSNPVTQCPVCLNQLPEDSEPNPTLCCLHYCCRSCWKEYLTTRIEQNLVLNCTCPISDCPAQPTHQFISSIISDRETVAKYSKTLLRGYVECCSNLTWCTNPQGCDQIVCKEGIGSVGTCSKCCWSSCFSCNFPEAHYPASCSHMSQWMDDGGYYEGMTVEAQSKHLAKLISKRCPSCHAQIEKNEGCLHMTCAKCNHGFCWRCLKPWKPTHKDYYNCSAMVSKAARQEKRFHDYNDRCTFHHQARDFAINLEGKVAGVNEALQMKCLTFVIDACKMLAQSHKVLAYSCVYSYYNQDTEKMDIMEQQTENLELHTNALQILLEETLLQCTDLASCIRLLKPEHLNTGLELIRRILERLLAILQHSTQVPATLAWRDSRAGRVNLMCTGCPETLRDCSRPTFFRTFSHQLCTIL